MKKQNAHSLSTDRIDKIANLLKNSTLGRPLIEFGLMKEVNIVLDNTLPTAGFFSEGGFTEPTITLNANLSDHSLTVALAHELCHVEQSIVSVVPWEFKHTNDAIKLTRIFEASASTFSTGVAYELAEKHKDSRYLHALEDWEDDDIRNAFLKARTANIPVEKDINAFVAGFKQWFKKRRRVSHYDKAAFECHNNVRNTPFLSLTFNEQAGNLTFKHMENFGHVLTHGNYLKKLMTHTQSWKPRCILEIFQNAYKHQK